MAPADYRYWQLPERALRQGSASLRCLSAQKPLSVGAYEILVRVRAVSLNYLDPIVAGNEYTSTIKEDTFIPCSDGVGEVEAIGTHVVNLRVGDRVAANFNIGHLGDQAYCPDERSPYMLGFRHDGMLSQYVVLPSFSVVSIPDSLTFEEASTLPCTGLTAWNALYGLRDAPLVPGDVVVCEGTGSVSIFAAHFALCGGAKVIISSSSDEKLHRVRALFTQEQQARLFTINYRQTPDWDKEILRISPLGATHIVEIGGAGTLEKAFGCVRRGGVIANIGFVSEADPAMRPDVAALSLKTQSIYRGFIVGNAAQFARMLDCVDLWKIKPSIAKVFDFAAVPEAFEYCAQGSYLGKVVVTL